MLPVVSVVLFIVVTATPVPQVLGHDETCLACHTQTTGLGTYHDPASIGCASCHGGDPAASDQRVSHAGMRLVPGNLADASASCGAVSCHPDAPARVATNLMTTMAGVVSIDRLAFGETHAAPHAVTTLTHTPADTHLRELCASCHLGAPKTKPGPVTQESRGGGCNACHLVYASTTPISKAARAGAAPLAHPALSVNTSDDHCFGCHSRSGRISLSYRGLAEVVKPYPKGAKLTKLADGRTTMAMPADVHAATMQCIDCHTAAEVMGDGVAHTSKREALQVTCEDCHTARPQTAAFGDLAPDAQRALLARGRDTNATFVRGRNGAILPGSVVTGGVVSTLPRAGGPSLAVRAPSSSCRTAAHERLTCESCHSAWAPRCNGCHTRYDGRGEGYDLLADRTVRGTWLETAADFRADPPTLGVRVGTDGRDRVSPYLPGMILMLKGTPRRLFAALAPHTIRREARSCASCHVDPQALGYGRGTLSYAAAGTVGTWSFRPAAKPGPDGLPQDAWVGFRDGRGGDSLHADQRALSVAEQDRVLAVGACLSCHQPDDAVLTAYQSDPLSVRNRRGPRCTAPIRKE